jgi:hypothetical protein
VANKLPGNFTSLEKSFNVKLMKIQHFHFLTIPDPSVSYTLSSTRLHQNFVGNLGSLDVRNAQIFNYCIVLSGSHLGLLRNRTSISTLPVLTQQYQQARATSVRIAVLNSGKLIFLFKLIRLKC